VVGQPPTTNHQKLTTNNQKKFLKFEEIALERTFLAIKPDGVQRGLVGEIIRRFETKGFTLVGLKFLKPSRELAEAHYGVHRERPFFAGLVEFITSGPVVAMVWEGDGVIAAARKMIGATNPLNAEPGTIRGDLGVNIGRNIIHGSDAPETAQSEVSLWFKEEELVDWQPQIMPWLHE
jgi:nucleoside-diphosphate kinase